MRPYLLYLLLWIGFLSGCSGGGTDGTGLGERRISGTVATTTAEPIVGASVTVLETGDSAVTDSNGQFAIDTAATAGDLNLEIESGAIKSNATVRNVEEEASTLDISISIDPRSNLASVSDIHIWARIVGVCDFYFNNLAIIEQSNPVPTEGVQCTAKVFASGNGSRLSGVPVGIEVRACDESRWRKIAQGAIGSGVNAGVGQINFKFIDNQRNCEYRIAAPYNVAGVKPLYLPIQTLTLKGSG